MGPCEQDRAAFGCLVPVTETSRLILFGQTVAVYCENRKKHVNEQNTGCICCDHFAPAFPCLTGTNSYSVLLISQLIFPSNLQGFEL